MLGRKGKTLGRPPLRNLSRRKLLGQERVNRSVPFKIFAKKFGVSVWTAHRLCVRWAPGLEDHQTA